MRYRVDVSKIKRESAYPDDITAKGIDSGLGYGCNMNEIGDTSFDFGSNPPKQKAPPLAMKNEAQG